MAERLWVEAAMTMIEITRLLLWQLDNWIFTKANPDLAKGVCEDGHEIIRLRAAE